MNKNILTIFSVFTCLQCIHAQDPTITRIYETMPEEIAKTESTHIIDMGFTGVGYTYEYAFAKKFTLNFGAGIAGSVGYFSSDVLNAEYWYYSFHPYVFIGTRYYGDLQKRLNKGESIEGNSGVFVALEGGYFLKPLIKHNTSYVNDMFAAALYLGCRRVFRHHFLLELQIGYSLGFNNYSDSDAGLKANASFGYIF